MKTPPAQGAIDPRNRVVLDGDVCEIVQQDIGVLRSPVVRAKA